MPEPLEIFKTYRTVNLINATDYPAYIDVNYHECMFFVCETLYINVYIQTGNKNTEN